MVGLLVRYLAALAKQRNAGQPQELEIELILGGYSYGSLIMSQLGDVADVLAPFQTPQSGTPAEEIALRADDLVQQTLKLELSGTPEGGPPTYHTVTSGGRESDMKQAGTQVSTVSDTLPPIRTRYLLVSPLLGPVAGMLGLGLPTVKGLKNLFRRADAPPDETASSMESALFVNNPTLAVFGTEEGFTSAKKLTSWAERLQAASPVNAASTAGGRQGSVVPRLFEWDMVEDAGHFWREPSVEGILKGKIRTWAA
ncbi:hypothetical protein K461DRAFT_279457, partial [Myriangium duriaei CBS 260.36]